MTETKSKVLEIKERMYELTNIDVQGAHDKADQLLVELIEHLGPNSYVMEKIIEYYNNIPKWI